MKRGEERKDEMKEDEKVRGKKRIEKKKGWKNNLTLYIQVFGRKDGMMGDEKVIVIVGGTNLFSIRYCLL